MSTRVKYIIGPSGTPLTLADLPAAKTARWVPRRKAELVCAVEGGLLSKDEAFDKYGLNDGEWEEWKTHYKQHGMNGLRVTHTQDYR